METWEALKADVEKSKTDADIAAAAANEAKAAADEATQNTLDAIALCEQATDNANTATNNANAAAANANDTAEHPTYIGEDNYVYQWNKTSKTYVKTSIYVKGEKGDQGIQGIQGEKGDKGEAPKIQNGTWWLYNNSTGQYENTGIGVSSDYELTKAKVEDVLTGNIGSHTHDQYLQLSNIKTATSAEVKALTSSYDFETQSINS